MTVQDINLTPAETVKTLLGAPQPAAAKARNQSYLFGPLRDFLGLGGGSVLALGLILLLAVPSTWYDQAAVWALVLALFVNNPHFAYSYQIFYGNFREKAFGASYPPLLRLRYVVAGIVVPIAMIGFFAGCIATENDVLLAVAANAMGFFVGWHYVKQGYGMIIVDSVLKKRFFTATEKKILLVNAYACWAASWLLSNTAPLGDTQFWGMYYYQFAVPGVIVSIGTYVAYAAAALTIVMLVRKALLGTMPPINGTIAYLVSLYLWLVFVQINPFFLLIIPAFHSLQYLFVVWRYKLNKERDTPESRLVSDGALPKKSLWRLSLFGGLGLALGGLGFWGIPMLLDRVVPYNPEVFGTTIFLFSFWIFINVHHYFLDNVMWRRENPDTGKYLFGRS